jgi:lipoprotein-anchoring transpeptidase ErfK/SrfK
VTVRTALVILLLAGALAAPAWAQEPPPSEPPPDPPPPVVPLGVTVAGIAVEGMTADEATVAVRSAFKQRLTLLYRARSWTVAPRRVGAAANVSAAVTLALAAPEGTAVPLRVAVDRARLRAKVKRWARLYSRAPVDSRVYLRDLRPFVTRGLAGHRLLRAEARAIVRTALKTHDRGALRLPSEVVRQRVTRRNFGPVVVIRRGSHRLYLYRAMHFRRSFGVAVGQAIYPTPLGRFSIVTRQRNPWWYPPASAWAAGASPIPPGPLNPLGTRWMGLSRAGVGIHGTPNPASIGYSASHGCIRMRIPEAEWLFERVRVGTPVFIVGA